ncbi:MAG: efflux RND transporter periplasmic adaptor subunit [Pirellulaceae bacterium]|nr:efflux RND transporter periplasmic adaptor subunit [Pirellulaceae bacterium]
MSHLIDPTDTVPAPHREMDADPSSPAETTEVHERRDDTPAERFMRAGLAWLPSLSVVVALGTVAWYGHSNDWRLPSAGTSMNATGSTDVAWCDSHGVPEDDCIVCRPGLIEDLPKLTFCNEHGVHGCVLCDPSIAETKQPTKPTPCDLDRAKRALALRPRTENLPVGSSPGSRIQFASIAAINKAGVDVEPVERRSVTEAISAPGEIRYNATKTAHISPQADGTVRRVFVEVGDWVKQGQTLAFIDSAEAGRLKTQLLAAVADERLRKTTLDRLRPLAGEAVAGKRLLESENDVQQASAVVDRTVGELGNLGLQVNLAQLRQLQPEAAADYVQRLGLGIQIDDEQSSTPQSMNWIAVVAPLDGQIVQRTATLGQVVDRGSELFRVVDTRMMWLDLRVPVEDASFVSLGQPVDFLPDGQRDHHQGNVTWISSEVDPQTRTVRVRAVLANTDQNLRNESFGRGRVVLRDEHDAIVVPELAVQWDGAGQIVFVRDVRFFEKDRPKFFVSRSVRTGVTQDGFVEIIAGVLPGEVVATSGSDVLRAQLLRSNLGAGCTCGQ